jgi:hypothetical protein
MPVDRRRFLAALVVAPAGFLQQVAAPRPRPPITVYKDPGCGCCKAWVEHVRAAGFAVTALDTSALDARKADLGVPSALASCHTAVVGRYVVEGHVPAADIDALLRERPAVVGIAVPGMPVGSPGMEMPGRPADRYHVLAFTADGRTRVFRAH